MTHLGHSPRVPGRDRRGPLDPAREILAERFARGELNAEEYRARLDELQRHSPGS